MSMEEGPTMISPTSLHSPLLPSSSGTPLFFRMFPLSGVIPTLVRMCVLGTIMSVRVNGAMGLAGLPGWISLIDWLCCSQKKILGGMDSGELNYAGKAMFCLALQTVPMVICASVQSLGYMYVVL